MLSSLGRRVIRITPTIYRPLKSNRLYATQLSIPDAYAGLSSEQKEMYDVARQFATDEMLPHAAKWDREEIFPVETLRELAKLGFGGFYAEEQYGGSAVSRLDASLILEALSTADVSTAAYLSIHNMVVGMIQRYGSDAQKDSLLPALCSCDAIASYCLTEPNAGSDAAALRTTAKRVGDDFVLNGSKAFISGGGATDVYLVMARTSGDGGARVITSFLVPKDAKGLSFGAKESKLGWNTQPTRAVMFDECVIPATAVLGEEGQGFKIAMQGLDGGRINIGACSLGAAQQCLEEACEHLQVRNAFGQTLAQFQSLQFSVAEMATKVHASRLMIRDAARLLDDKSPLATAHCAMAKLFACDECYQVVDGCLQLFGGYGFLKDYPIERYLRDIRVHRILEGTDNVMRIVVSRSMLNK